MGYDRAVKIAPDAQRRLLVVAGLLYERSTWGASVEELTLKADGSIPVSIDQTQAEAR